MSDTPAPESMLSDGSAEEAGAMGAGAAEAPDLATHDGGDATGGGSPGDPDAMGGHQHEDDNPNATESGLVSPGSTAGKNPEPGGDE